MGLIDRIADLNEVTTSTRETLAAADLIPNDVIPVRGYTVTGYPHAGPLGRTKVPVETGNGFELTLLVPSEEQYEVIR